MALTVLLGWPKHQKHAFIYVCTNHTIKWVIITPLKSDKWFVVKSWESKTAETAVLETTLTAITSDSHDNPASQNNAVLFILPLQRSLASSLLQHRPEELLCLPEDLSAELRVFFRRGSLPFWAKIARIEQRLPVRPPPVVWIMAGGRWCLLCKFITDKRNI